MPRRLGSLISHLTFFICLCLHIASAAAQVVDVAPLIPRLAVTDAELEANDWREHHFDFGDPQFNFRSIVPVDATVDTNEMEPLSGENILQYRGLATIGISDNNLEIEGSVVGARFAEAPASAQRYCAAMIERAGYTLTHRSADQDLARTQLLGLQRDDDRVVKGIVAECYARGDNLLMVNFIFDIDRAKTDDDIRSTINRAAGYFGPFISSIRFDDGIAPTMGNRLQQIPVRLGDREAHFAAPDLFEILRNDFESTDLPARLTLLQRDDEDAIVGAVWLAATEAPEQPGELADAGLEAVVTRFQTLFVNTGTPELQGRGNEPVFTGTDVPTITFRHRTSLDDGRPFGDLLSMALWHDGVLYTVGSWSGYAPENGLSNFVSRLPVRTTFDLFATRLVTELGVVPDKLPAHGLN